MKKADVLIVGGGPAGSSCARELNAVGYQVLILDQAVFPRQKLCAGWITPRVFRLLQIRPEQYPGGLMEFRRLHFYFKGLHLPLPTRQYAVRRIEFDNWLLQRSGAEVLQHKVKEIRQEGEEYVVDGLFSAPHLVGAGGSSCPVARQFFRGAGESTRRGVSALEVEFPYSWSDPESRLWFFEHRLPGYSWYVPKKNGYLALGIGAVSRGLQERGLSLRREWDAFLKKLQEEHRIKGDVPPPAGHSYLLHDRAKPVQWGHVYLSGDSAGLATRDMGEGIGPAIQSGILAARAIRWNQSYSLRRVRRYSFPDFFRR